MEDERDSLLERGIVPEICSQSSTETPRHYELEAEGEGPIRRRVSHSTTATIPAEHGSEDLAQSLLPKRTSDAQVKANLCKSSRSTVSVLIPDHTGAGTHTVDASDLKPIRLGLTESRFANLELLRPWFPDIDPKEEQAQTFRTWHSRRDIVLKTCSVTAVTIFIINLVCTIIFKVKWGSANDIGTLFKGDCIRTHRLNSLLHVLINILSTLLLGSSNLCMQLLVAPRRSEIDRAHRKFTWLDTGVPSVRNLKHISRERLIVWIILGLSSIPLHFL